MKKLLNFIKNNWMFLFFSIPFILICFTNKRPDNDIWFILNNGRYIFSHGIPYTDPFSIHEGLKYVMQQWGTSSLFWGLYDLFGHQALIVFIYIISFVFMTIFYKLCYVVSEKKNLSIIVTSIVFCFIHEYIVLRPQVISYSLLMLEILLMELYIKKKNKKYLYALPFLSLIIINMHTAMWYFQFVFMVPFILNGINFKKIKMVKKLRINKYEVKPLLIAMLIMFVVGFINPYGYDSLTYIFKSYGISMINSAVGEMNPMSWEEYNGKIIFLYLFIFILLNYIRKDLKMDIRHFLFICGISLLGFMHNKCFPLFVLIFTYALMFYIKSINFDFNLLKSKVVKSLSNGLAISLGFCLFVTFFYTIYYSYSMYDFRENYKITPVVNHILDNYDKDKVVLYTGFDTGGYAEFMGLKSYFDGRAELYFKRFNEKEDIFMEAMDIESKTGFDFDKFVKKYNFTHIIVYDFSFFNMYLEKNDDYEMRYSYNINRSDEDMKFMLYVRKDVEVLE